MAVLIKGLQMPKNCDACPMLYEYRFCALTDDHASSIGWEMEKKRMPNCPLIELPDHGDLIDREEAADEACMIWCRNSSGDDAMQETIGYLRNTAPVVIPAERSEK